MLKQDCVFLRKITLNDGPEYTLFAFRTFRKIKKIALNVTLIDIFTANG